MLRAKKSLGQNFLFDGRVVDRIVNALNPGPDETIVEIGPGRGALTAQLIERAGRLIAVEYDRELSAYLREQFAGADNFKLVEADALVSDFCALVAPTSQAKLVANLPYNISTAILQLLIEQRRCLTEMILMLQREVVDRIIAPPGSSERGYLSVLTQAYCDVETLFDVAPDAFRPVPKVWSTVVRLRPFARMAAEVNNEAALWQLVGAGFAQRRKTIFNNLRNAPGKLLSRIEAQGGARRTLDAARLEPQRRAETLTLDEWARLSNVITSLAEVD